MACEPPKRLEYQLKRPALEVNHDVIAKRNASSLLGNKSLIQYTPLARCGTSAKDLYFPRGESHVDNETTRILDSTWL